MHCTPRPQGIRKHKGRSTFDLRRGWMEAEEKWGWTRDPPVSVHKSGTSDPEKAKRKQVGRVHTRFQCCAVDAAAALQWLLQPVCSSSNVQVVCRVGQWCRLSCLQTLSDAFELTDHSATAHSHPADCGVPAVCRSSCRLCSPRCVQIILLTVGSPLCADQPARAGAAGVHLRHLQVHPGAAAVHAVQPRLLQALSAEEGAVQSLAVAPQHPIHACILTSA